jgi:glycosyltransferase involved in cell wall biosynthesis
MQFAIVGSRGYPSSYGGFETFVRRLAPHLVASGDEVTVYGRASGWRTERRSVDGVDTVATAGIERKALSTATTGLTASVHARRRRFDAALVLNCANGPWLPLLRTAGIPVAVNVDGIEWERDKWSSLGKLAFRAGARATARFADEIVVDSNAIGRVWTDRFGVTPTYIPYGADVVDHVPDQGVRALGLQPGSYVLVVARLVPENNVELLMDAVALMQPAVPTVIVGSANYDSPVEQRVRSLEKRGALIALGHVDDQDLLAQLWNSCGVYFHGHSVGGTNPALLQALGFGAPTLAIDTPFNREVLGDESQLVPHDPQQIAGRIAALLGDPARRAALAAHGRSVVAERYRWNDVCERYREVLVGLAERRQRDSGRAPSLEHASGSASRTEQAS